MIDKKSIIEAIESLPDDASVDDLLYHIYVVLKIERGLAAADAGDTVSVEDMRKEAANWASE